MDELKIIADAHAATLSLTGDARVQYLELALQFQAELNRRGVTGQKAEFLLQALPSRIDYVDTVKSGLKFNAKSAVDSALNSGLGQLVNGDTQKAADPHEITEEILKMSPAARINWARKRGLA